VTTEGINEDDGSQLQDSIKKGITNVAADALSRCPDPESVFAISTNTPAWLKRLQEGYLED
jgi:hypothetical protein